VTSAPGLDCDQVVELVTDYLEGALDEATATRVREHLADCPGCESYVDQVRRTSRTLGHVSASALSSEARSELLKAFRDFHRGH
jgi:predicted anti-sigma-YlaC factor YlaD